MKNANEHSLVGKLTLLDVLPVLLLASTASIMATDLYAPSLPDLPALLDTTPLWVKLTLSLNVLALGVTQLIHGPLSDRYGRRKAMLVGMVVFSLASLGCSLATSIEQLLFFRVLQGTAAAVEAVVGLAVIREVFTPQDQVRAFAWFGIVIAMVPAAAPILGGYVHVWLGWRANFWIMTIAGALSVLLVWWKLPESAPPDRQPLIPRDVVKENFALLKNNQFFGFALLEAMALAVIFAFITASPFILIGRFGVPTEQFGYYQMVIVAAYAVGSVLAERLAKHFDPMRILHLGLVVFGVGIVSVVAVVASGLLSPVSLTITMSVVLFGAGPLFATCPVLALNAAEGRGGVAAALLGATEMGIGGLASATVGVLPWRSSVSLAVVLVTLLTGAVLAYGMGRKGQRS
ncbi:MAG: multidrug effflux MFS transporter [Pseudomonadota bacterium]